jgi:hypothetical protein
VTAPVRALELLGTETPRLKKKYEIPRSPRLRTWVQNLCISTLAGHTVYYILQTLHFILQKSLFKLMSERIAANTDNKQLGLLVNMLDKPGNISKFTNHSFKSRNYMHNSQASDL